MHVVQVVGGGGSDAGIWMQLETLDWLDVMRS